jgi:anaphase-promoting complex subunit 3
MMASPGAKPHVHEHFRQVVWYSLDNNLITNALFVAERLLALNDRDQSSRHLLGICFLRAGRPSSAYNVTGGTRHLGCAYVFAQSCRELAKYREGMLALENCLAQPPSKWTACTSLCLLPLQTKQTVLTCFPLSDDHGDASRNHLPDAGAVYCLLGHMQRASGDSKRAMDTYIEALKLNPYLWEAFDGLIELGIGLGLPF